MDESSPIPLEEKVKESTPANIQVNQVNHYIQLINETHRFPDASTLSGYDEQTKKWILSRTEIEQEARHRFMDKMLNYDHEINLMSISQTHKTSRHAQKLGGILVIIVVTIAGILLYSGKPIEALSALLGPLAYLILAVISTKIDEKKNKHKD